jgi:drug/metabolite transporter (DMT)-like permease
MPPKPSVVSRFAGHPLISHLGWLLFTSLATSVLNEFIVHTLNFRHAAFVGLLGPVGIAVSGVITGGLAGRKAPLRSHVVAGVCLYFAYLLGSKAQLHLAYSEFLVAKASKLAPTMLIGAVWLKKRYSRADILAAALALVGLTLVLQCGSVHSAASVAIDDDEELYAQQCAVSRLRDGNWLTGIALISTALLCDGLYANTQEQQMLQWGATSREVASWGMGIASVMFVASSLFSRGIWHGLQAAVADPMTALTLLAYTGSNYGASLTALNAVRDLGAAKASFLLAICKAFAVVASMALFPKATTALQGLGIVLVFAAVAVAILHKSAAQTKTAAAAGKTAALIAPDFDRPAPLSAAARSKVHKSDPSICEPRIPLVSVRRLNTVLQDQHSVEGTVTDIAVSSELSLQQQDAERSPIGIDGGLSRAAGSPEHPTQLIAVPELPVVIRRHSRSHGTDAAGDTTTTAAHAHTPASPQLQPALQLPNGVPAELALISEPEVEPGSLQSAPAEDIVVAGERPSSIESARERSLPSLAGPLPDRPSSAPGGESSVITGKVPLVLEAVQGSASRLIHRAVASPLVSRALSRIASASELAFNGVSSATGIERPQSALHDSLSPLASRLPVPAHWKQLRRGVDPMSPPLGSKISESPPSPRLLWSDAASSSNSAVAVHRIG